MDRGLLRVVLAALAAVCLPAAIPAAEPLAVFECQERLGLDWPKTLVTYRVALRPGALRDAGVRVLDAADRPRPCQLWRVERHLDGSIAAARASFLAELPAGGGYVFRLVPGGMAAEDPRLGVATSDGALVLQNAATAVRLPAKGEIKPEKPLRFARDHAEMLPPDGRPAAGIAPGPFQGIRLADGRFTGGSCFRSEAPERAPKVTAISSTVTEQGPVFVEARVRYAFDQGGFYQWTARLLAGDPALRIDEQMDLGGTFPPEEDLRVVVSLAGRPGGFRPDRVFWCAARGMGDRDAAFQQALARHKFDFAAFGGESFGHRTVRYDRPGKMFDLLAWYPWHPAAHYFGLVELQALSGGAGAPMVAVVPLHAGTWRGMHQWFRLPQQFPEVWTLRDDVAVHWPLRPQPHPNTMLHTGEPDPELPPSFTRRVWALVAGPMQYHATLHPWRAREGHVTLDQYKDWQLDWPSAGRSHPRLVFRRDDLGRLAARLPSLPGGETMGRFLYFHDDAKRREDLWRGLTSDSIWSGPWGQCRGGLKAGGDAQSLPWVASYRHTQMAGWANNADELLASPGLDPRQRARLRTDVAALCHLLTESDFNPRGSMVHLGNPNMPINRFCALPLAAALIPDHPQANRWLDLSAEYLRYKLSMNVAPGGAWGELLTYFGASAPHVMQAATVLGNTGRLDEKTARLAAMPAAFTVNLLSPKDPRFGKRTLPNWGHEGYDLTSHWLVAAGLMRRADPELAKALVWSWDQLGRPVQSHHDAGFSERAVFHAELLLELPPGYVPKHLASTWWPGFGAVLRAHAGDPNETFFAYRQGYMTSHCDANQGDFVLYSKGAPLTTLSLFGYAIHDDRSFGKLAKEHGWHNRVRFGSKSNDGGWPGGGPISGVHAHGFSDSVDYLLGLGDYGPQRWSRQVLFLKGRAAGGPNYFVLRDSFHNPQGDPPKLERKWWYLKTPGKKEQVRAEAAGLVYTNPFGRAGDASLPGTRLAVRFLQPAAVETETRDASQGGPLYNQSAINWQNAQPKPPKEPAGSLQVEETISVTAVGPIAAGQDILVALYPQRPDEAPPRYEPLADGAVRITTGESTDYVFVGRTPLRFQQGDVAFEGTAGAVRVYPNEVHLVIAEGPGTVAYKSVRLQSAAAAHRVTPAGEVNRPQSIQQPAQASAVVMPASDAGPAPPEQLAPGVRRRLGPGGAVYVFDSPDVLDYGRDRVRFVGRRGAIVVDDQAQTVRLVLVDGWQIGYREASVQQWAPGPVEVTHHADRLTGRTGGAGRLVHCARPAKLDRLPVLLVDGQTFAPGTHEETLILPVLPGEHGFEIRPLPQPAVFRTWQAW